MPEYLIGVDLGQTNDYTAIAVLERERSEKRSSNTYLVRHLDRLQRGTPYPQQVERVSEVLDRVERSQRHSDDASSPRLVVDQTGVGRPVVDMLRQAGHDGLTAVTITAGDTPSREGRDYRVPKRELVSVLQVLLQTDRLGIVSSLQHAETLTRELLAFKVKISAAGNDTYGNDWRENPHDDMVLAVALATWAGENERSHNFAFVGSEDVAGFQKWLKRNL